MPTSRAGLSGAGTIYIVDDEEMVVRSLESLLTLETSHAIRTFLSPSRALESLDQEDVHLIVADFLMPERDGVSFLKEARARQPETTRVLLTGYADKENAIRAINEAGLYYYLEKPWDNRRMEIVVRNGVERSMLFRELSDRVADLEEVHEELSGMRERLVRAFL